MGKSPSKDPIEQVARYLRILAWVSISVAGTGFVFLIYLIASGK